MTEQTTSPNTVSKPIYSIVPDKYIEISGFRFDISNPTTRNAIMGSGTIQNVVPLNVYVMRQPQALKLKRLYHDKSNSCSGNGCSVCWQMERDEYWEEQRNERNNFQFSGF